MKPDKVGVSSQERALKSDYEYEKNLIVEQLLEVPEGDTIEYSEFSFLTKLDIQNEFRYLLDSALDFVLKHHKMVFRNVRNTGYRRLTPPEIVDDTRAQDRINGAAEKGVERLTATDFGRLSGAHQKRHNAKLAGLALIKVLATEKTIKVLESTLKDAKATTVEARKALETLLEELKPGAQN